MLNGTASRLLKTEKVELKSDTMNKTKQFLTRKYPNAKKIIAYQNIKDFAIPSLQFVGLNPTHKILIIGKRKRKKNSHKVDTNRNHENIAMVLKNFYGSYVITLYLVGVYLLCWKLL